MRNTVRKAMLETGVRGCRPVRIKTVEDVVILDVRFTENYSRNEKYLIADTLEYTLSAYIDKQVVIREYSIKDTEELQVKAYLQAMQV